MSNTNLVSKSVVSTIGSQDSSNTPVSSVARLGKEEEVLQLECDTSGIPVYLPGDLTVSVGGTAYISTSFQLGGTEGYALTFQGLDEGILRSSASSKKFTQEGYMIHAYSIVNTSKRTTLQLTGGTVIGHLRRSDGLPYRLTRLPMVEEAQKQRVNVSDDAYRTAELSVD
ncbi:hypothetical protein HDU81_001773 [Chytriomyces hyalinus]|nr:hypothetical protein HDU81_001773 [Chytriomyces hyalinus]